MSISVVGSNINRNAKAIELYRGQSRTVRIYLLNSSKEPLSTVGMRFILTVKRSIDDPDFIFKKDSSVSAAQILPLPPLPDGVIEIYFDSSDTKNQEPGEYIFDLWVEIAQEGESLKYPLIEVSQFIIKKPVTSF
jgi:hypothetical protein